MSRTRDMVLTALAPAIWGSTYLVTTEMLPAGYPVTLAVLRALPAGLLLLAVTRCWPPRAWLGKVFVLGALNFALFWTLLFVAAYRLPGGVAATLGALQPLVVIGLARGLLGTRISAMAVFAALAGLAGVAMLLLGPEARLDPIGIAAGLGGTISMAAGTVLSRKWQPPVPPLSFAAWQLTAGGLLLVPLALLVEPPLPALSTANLAGLVWLGLIGAGFTYWLWFRGIARLAPNGVAMLGMMSPMTAVALGWLVLGEALSPPQMIGAAIVLVSVVLGQRRTPDRPAAPPALARAT